MTRFYALLAAFAVVVIALSPAAYTYVSLA